MTLNCRHKIVKFKPKEEINRPTMNKFIIKLSYETWGSIFDSNDIGWVFNYFCNTQLRILYPNSRIQN